MEVWMFLDACGFWLQSRSEGLQPPTLARRASKGSADRQKVAHVSDRFWGDWSKALLNFDERQICFVTKVVQNWLMPKFRPNMLWIVGANFQQRNGNVWASVLCRPPLAPAEAFDKSRCQTWWSYGMACEVWDRLDVIGSYRVILIDHQGSVIWICA